MTGRQARLILVRGETSGGESEFAIEPGGAVLGRAAECQVRVDDSEVSRRHAELQWEGDALLLVHLSSVNPTKVNGAAVEGRRRLADGDEIQVSGRLAFRVELPEVGDATRAASFETRVSPPAPAGAAPAARAPAEKTVLADARTRPTYQGDIHIAIVGAGPAGIAAASQAAKCGAPHTLLERSKLANTIELYQKGKKVMAEPPRLPLQEQLEVGFEEGTREQVLEEWNAAVARSGVNAKIGPGYELVGLEGSLGKFSLKLKGGETLSATHVVLSIGLQGNLRTFGVPGDDLPHVTHQLDDPAAYTGKRIVVVGVGDAGIENAMALLDHDNDVIVVNRAVEIDRAKSRNKALLENAAKSSEIPLTYYTNTAVHHFEPGAVVFNTDNGQERLEVDLVIGRLGAIPPRRFLEDIGVEFPSKDREAVPEVSDSYESNVPGIHIVGALAGYPLIKNCMNQGYEVVEHILGHDVTPADEPVLREKFAGLGGTVSENLERIRRTIPVFSGLTPVQLRDFLFDSEVKNLKPGEVVFRRNEFENSFFSILQGEVEAELPRSDKQAALDLTDAERKFHTVRISEGNFFGEAGLISGRRRSATVKAAGDCIVIESPRNAINKLIKSIDEVRRVIDAAFIQRTLENVMAGLPAKERALLAEQAEVRTYGAGKILFEEGDEPDGLHLIRRGSVAISKQRDGRDRVIQYVLAGNYIGHMALLNPDGRRNATVTAKVLTETVLLPTPSILPVLERQPELRRMLQEKADEIRNEEMERDATPEGGTIIHLIGGTGAFEASDMLVIDEALCVRCDNCEKACAETHQGISRLDREAGPTYQTSTGRQLHTPVACQHCENPKCMEDCPPDALRRDPDGEVYIKDNCIGCGNCATNCPYGVIQMAHVLPYRPRGLLGRLLFGDAPSAAGDHGDEPHETKAMKCDLCRGLPTPKHGRARAACVASCPTGAIVRVGPRQWVDEILARE